MQPSSESGGVEVLDPRGDLRLIVGADQAAFQVSSPALARSSPVWETMLYGPFAEGHTQQERCNWEILLMKIIRKEFESSASWFTANLTTCPAGVANDELLYLAVLADKYDMIGSLKLSSKNWFKNPDCVVDSVADELLDYLSVC
jgi:hypothetical protein